MIKNLLADFADAWLGIQRRPFRFLLSGLGIGIGVSALIAMLSIGEGAQRNALEKIESLGINSVRIEGLNIAEAGGALHKQTNLSKGLTTDDARSIKQQLPHGSFVGEYLKKENVDFFSSKKSNGTLIAVSPDWFAAERLTLVTGRFLLPEDIINQARVCIVAAPLANKLKVSLGQIIRNKHYLYRIVGITAEKGRLLSEGTGLSTIDFDTLLMVPKSTFPFYVVGKNKNSLDGMVVTLPDGKSDQIRIIADRLLSLLKKRHRGVNDFLVIAPLQLLTEAKATQRIFSLVMGAIAGLSILVGGIGVMNVMLANITEQTREIGLRIAVGATKARIISLYLCQSVLLTTISGLWGIIGGMVIAQSVQSYAGWNIGYSFSGLLIGPIFALLSGVAFGIYPAFKAASTAPAIALREA